MSTTAQQVATIPSHVFKAYDIRGKAGEELNESFAYLLGVAFAEKVWQLGYREVIVGRDNRESSPVLHRALIAGLTNGACKVVDIGEVVTPMFYFSMVHFNIPCGIMITASHNPGDENGFKIAVGGTTIFGSAIQELRQAMHRIFSSQGVVNRLYWQEQYVRTEDIASAYFEMLAKKVQLGPRRLKVVVDCGNGTASSFAPKALERLGCEVVPLYCDSDPSFPNHHPDPVVPENLQDLIARVKAEKADLGVAFDGDGDRLGVVDESGQILWGDQLMILFWREILPKYPGCDAPVEVKCSQALVDEIQRLGGKPFFHKTGHSHVKATLKSRKDIPFAGEMSGHLFFQDEYYGYDDALYAAARLLRILSHSDKKLSELIADAPRYFATPETRVNCPEERKAEVLQAFAEAYRNRSDVAEVVDVDGYRVQFEDGWGLVRSSNTQPILVLRAEGKTEAALKRIKADMVQVLQSIGEGFEIPW